MKMTKMLTFGCCAILLLSVALEAHAASARARCRVRDGRVRVMIDGQNLLPGLYRAVVTNAISGEVARTERGKEARATVAVPNVDLDFDSTAQANDVDSFISPDFADAGDNVRARVVSVATGTTVARATAACTR